jgi:inosose dehydratase
MKVANAPCSWGVLEFDLKGETDGYPKVLDEMIQSGYSGTELGDWGFMPTDSLELKKALDNRNLSMVGAFVPVDFSNKSAHKAGIAEALKIAKLLKSSSGGEAKVVLADHNGHNKIRVRYAGEITPDMGLSDEDWSIFSHGVNETARRVFDETGLISVFHHHCAGYIETPDEVERLLDLTDPEVVGLCFDTGHYAFGGGNPVEGLKKFISRVKHVHFKDFDPDIASKKKDLGWDYFDAVRNGIFCELGKGNVDFSSIIESLRKINYKDWIVVEQDIIPGMGSPLLSATRNREYLQSLGI